tara:strand:- start:1964 stop:2155 length:192 start_codon:yes stop_codon:yes gene_type:complete
MSERINERIIDKIRSRLDVGAKKYGEEILDTDPREWVQEALEEVLDLAVYISAQLIRIKDASK